MHCCLEYMSHNAFPWWLNNNSGQVKTLTFNHLRASIAIQKSYLMNMQHPQQLSSEAKNCFRTVSNISVTLEKNIVSLLMKRDDNALDTCRDTAEISGPSCVFQHLGQRSHVDSWLCALHTRKIHVILHQILEAGQKHANSTEQLICLGWLQRFLLNFSRSKHLI